MFRNTDMKNSLFALLLICSIGALVGEDVPCTVRKTPYGAVCVCNSSHCDTVERPPPLTEGRYYRYTTSSDCTGFQRSTGGFTFRGQADYSNNNSVVFVVNPNVKYQEILGFGGAFTDSVGWNVKSLPLEAQEKFIQSYFGPSGLEYTLGRVPIGSSDFSPRRYSYDEMYDENLTHFSLVEEDYQYKIPLIQKAISVNPRKMKLVGNTFTTPSWLLNDGYIKQGLYHAWAKYHIKFFDAYANNNITFWGMSGGNQVCFYLLTRLGLGTLPHNHIVWLRDHMAPLLEASKHSDVKFLALDDQRPFVKFWISRFARDPVALQKMAGVALHWYFDWYYNATIYDDIHNRYPDKLLIYTESSVNQFIFGGQPVELGSWQRAAFYAYNIIENLNHWVNGYIDWNLALDTSGGPYLLLSLDAAIIVNSRAGEFYKNPMFYAMGHFSKFIPPGSKRVDVKTNQFKSTYKRNYDDKIPFVEKLSRTFKKINFSNDYLPREENGKRTDKVPPIPPFPVASVPPVVSCVATVTPDKMTTVIVFNGKDSDVDVIIEDVISGSIRTKVSANSLNTFVYWRRK